MSLAAASLMFWPLLYYGVKHGDFSRTEGLALAVIWTAWLGFVTTMHLSPWFYFVPTVLVTIYMIWVVLGPDVEAPKGSGTS